MAMVMLVSLVMMPVLLEVIQPREARGRRKGSLELVTSLLLGGCLGRRRRRRCHPRAGPAEVAPRRLRAEERGEIMAWSNYQPRKASNRELTGVMRRMAVRRSLAMCVLLLLKLDVGT